MLARYGEERVAFYLEREGYELLARNWRCKRGEIDIIARDGHVLVFVEVKTRCSTRLGTAAEAVDRHKRERLRELALCYISKTGQAAAAYRFDVAAVDAAGKVLLIKDAF